MQTYTQHICLIYNHILIHTAYTQIHTHCVHRHMYVHSIHTHTQFEPTWLFPVGYVKAQVQVQIQTIWDNTVAYVGICGNAAWTPRVLPLFAGYMDSALPERAGSLNRSCHVLECIVYCHLNKLCIIYCYLMFPEFLIIL